MHTFEITYNLWKNIETTVLVVLVLQVVILFTIISFLVRAWMKQTITEYGANHELAKKISANDHYEFPQDVHNEAGLNSYIIAYEDFPEEWEYMWHALASSIFNRGTGLFISHGGCVWVYKYSIGKHQPVHIFYHACHATDSKPKWLGVDASEKFQF